MRPKRSSGSTNNIPLGAHVFDSNNDKMGTVLEIDASGTYFTAEKGWLFPQDVYIPMDAVSSVNADGVYLRYSKAELQQQDWTNPPTATTTDRATTTQTTTTASQSATAATNTATDATSQRDVRVPLREEELVVDKQRQQEGNVHLHKDVVTEQQNITVPVTHEEVHIERVQADANTPADDAAFTERDIDIPVMGEQVVTDKRVKAADEVRLRKDTITEQQQVSDTVRKERLHVQGDGSVQIDQDIPDDTTTGTQQP